MKRLLGNLCLNIVNGVNGRSLCPHTSNSLAAADWRINRNPASPLQVRRDLISLNALAVSLVNDDTLALQVCSNAVCASLRNLLVDFLAALGRSSTNDLNVPAALDAVKSLLSFLGQSGLALCERYEYEVLNLNFLSGSGSFP